MQLALPGSDRIDGGCHARPPPAPADGDLMADGSDAQAALTDLHDDYEVVRELGRGGTAVVYLARDRVLQRDVAIKVIQPQLTADAEAVARFAREARTVAQLEHPNIVTIYAVRRLSGANVALVMQYVPGLSATEALLRDGPFDADRARRVLIDVAEALAYAHERGVVHRDVKPENIFLDERSGRALLSDFGIARTITGDAQVPVTMANVAIGTPAYMSPEQLDGSPVDGRSDVYSLGLVGWEILSGRRPWQGEGIYGVIYRQRHEALAPLDVLRPDLPGDLVRAIEVALAKDPRERWESAAHFLAALTGHPPPLPVRRARRDAPQVPPTPSRPWFAPVPAAVASAKTLRWLRPAARAGASAADRPQGTDRDDRQGRATLHGNAPAEGAGPLGLPAWRVGRAAPNAGVSPARRYAPALVTLGVAAVAMLGATLSTASTAGPPPPPRISGAEARRLAGLPPASDGLSPDAGTPDAGTPNARAAYSGGVDSGAADSLGGDAAREGDRTAGEVGAGRETGPAVALTTRPGPAASGADPTGAADSSGVVAAEHAGRAPNADADAPRETLAVVGTRVPPATSATAGRPPRPPAAPPVVTEAMRATPPAGTPQPAAQMAHVDASGADGAGTGTAPRASSAALVAIAPGGAHTCALAGDGTASCWGGNDRGQLGDGTTMRRAAPTPVSGGLRFAGISAGLGHTCAVTPSGAAYCWGRNDRGQLGDGTRAIHAAPTRVAGAGPFRTVGAGASHTCALARGGEAYCWGSDAFGQLGAGANPGTGLRPVRVAAPAARFLALAVGWNHTCALTTRRYVGCWGQNSAGQLGDGSVADRAVPEPVAGDRRYDAIAAGAVHSCAVAAGTGELFCWGKNDYGQLGTGDAADQPRPTLVAGGHRFVSVTAGSMHSCALTTDGQAFCWGRNGYGQLGDGTTEDRNAPVRVQTDERLTAVWASGSHTCATTAAGSTRCWGYNLDGQLGDGTRAHRARPVAVGAPRG